MQLPIHNTSGEVVGQLEASDAVFALPSNPDLLHQALVYYQANQRQGTHNTRTRGQVSGGGHKPFVQKGTGRARQGTIRAPHMRHGGIVFGPHPRSYRQKLPKQMRRKAMCMALSGKAATGKLVVVQGIETLDGKTKTMAGMLRALGADGSTLVVTNGAEREAARSVRNLPKTKALRADLLNGLDLLRYDRVVMTPDAVQHAQEAWAERRRSKKALTPAGSE